MNFADKLAADLTNALKGKPAPKAKPTPKAKAAKAPSKPAKAAPAAKATPVQATPAAPRYALGKPFVAKADGRYPQAENWAALVAVIGGDPQSGHGQKPATKADLVAALKKADRPNAAGFVQGRIRGGHIIVVS